MTCSIHSKDFPITFYFVSSIVDISKFHIYSVGRAAENRKLSSHELEIYPIEHMGYIDGDVNSEKTENEAKGVDAEGREYSVKVTTSNSIKATWLKWGSNRLTPPDVRRGERLFIWRYADTDKFYWTSSGLDDHLRRLETVTYVFSNTTDEATKVLTPDNSYFVEVSTHSKLITLGTCKSDGEPYAYSFQFNTKEGTVTLADDVGNYIELSSKDSKITLENIDKTLLSLDKKVLNIFAVDAVNIETKALSMKTETTDIKGKTNVDGDFSSKGSFKNNGKQVGSEHTHPDPQGGTVPPPN